MKLLIMLVSLVVSMSVILVGCDQEKIDSKGSANEKSSKVNIYVVRHGETMLNKTDRVQGWSDAILTPNGEKNIKTLGKGLENKNFDKVISSDSGRAIQTAKIILNENKNSKNPQLTTNKLFREFNFGNYEGDYNDVMHKDIAKMMGLSYADYQEKEVNPKTIANSVYKLDKKRNTNEDNWKAENYTEIKQRVNKGMQDITKNAQSKGDKNVLIVSHGLTIRSMVDMYSNDVNPGLDIDNGSVTKFTYNNGKFKLKKANDTKYLK